MARRKCALVHHSAITQTLPSSSQHCLLYMTCPSRMFSVISASNLADSRVSNLPSSIWHCCHVLLQNVVHRCEQNRRLWRKIGPRRTLTCHTTSLISTLSSLKYLAYKTILLTHLYITCTEIPALCYFNPAVRKTHGKQL